MKGARLYFPPADLGSFPEFHCLVTILIFRSIVIRSRSKVDKRPHTSSSSFYSYESSVINEFNKKNKTKHALVINSVNNEWCAYPEYEEVNRKGNFIDQRIAAFQQMVVNYLSWLYLLGLLEDK